MNTTSSAPGSPPELSNSRSSKSSSICSSSTFSSPDGVVSDITNFEDIELDDEQRRGQETPTRANGYIYTAQPKSFVRPTSRDGGLETRPRRPSLKSQVAAAVRDQHVPVWDRTTSSPNLRRQRTNPQAPHSAAPTSNPRQSFEPPMLHRAASMSTSSLTSESISQHSLSSAASLAIPRRGLRQTRRKSVQELEAEYHDSDDDLPDEASLWNVPVSPFVTTHRSSRSSPGVSPNRSPADSAPRPIPLGHAVSAPEQPPKHKSLVRSLPRSRPFPPRTTSLGSSFSNPSSPRVAQACNSRSKSWNFALAGLSEEARIISEKLDHFMEIQEISQDEQNSQPRPRPGLEKAGRPRTHTGAVQLPPIQKGNLDFMPFSKEKEAVLSRTRPSWLPPKDPKEERRHLKEYQRMMAASVEAEKKRQVRAQVRSCEKDNSHQVLAEIWKYYISDSTDEAAQGRKALEFCWRGVTPQLRGKVWPQAIGNSLGLTSQTYDKARQRAQEIREKPEDALDRVDKMLKTSLIDIERDAETAFPELNLFQRHGPLWQNLIEVCEAYACYRTDVGYVYGVQLVAAALLLQTATAADVFILLANVLNKHCPSAFQVEDRAVMSRTYNHAISNLATKSPRLHEYLFGSLEEGGLGLTGEEVFKPMFQSLFCNGLDAERICRVLDVWIFEGDRILVQSATAVLSNLQPQIFDVRGSADLKRRNVQEMLGWGPFNRTTRGGHWNLESTGSVDQFVDAIREAGLLDCSGH